MKDSNTNVHFFRPSNSPTDASSVTFSSEQRGTSTRQMPEPRNLSFSTSSSGKPQKVSFSTERCAEKGCVFPASSTDSGKCVYHTRQQKEPVLFRSHQPTGLFLDPARMTPADREYDGGHKRDRRRMAALWEQFQSDGAA
jgi:hypothetical protein